MKYSIWTGKGLVGSMELSEPPISFSFGSPTPSAESVRRRRDRVYAVGKFGEPLVDLGLEMGEAA